MAFGAAHGLEYLHEQCNPKIVHRDLKAANILLDDDFEAVLGDFGLAKLVDEMLTHVTTQVRGTMGHIAPEYLTTGKSSEKTDVFGYGITLLEIITGQRAIDFYRLDEEEDVLLLDHVSYCAPFLGFFQIAIYFLRFFSSLVFAFLVSSPLCSGLNKNKKKSMALTSLFARNRSICPKSHSSYGFKISFCSEIVVSSFSNYKSLFFLIIISTLSEFLISLFNPTNSDAHST